MNTLPFIALFPTLAWLAYYVLTGNRQDALLFIAVIVIIAWAMVMAVIAVKDDQEIFS